MDIPALIVKFLSGEGLTILVVVYLVLERLGPTVVTKIFPALLSERKRIQAERLESEKRRFEEEKKVENRLFDLVGSMMQSTTKLNYTLETMSSYLQGQSVLMREISLDLARIYTVLKIEREKEVGKPDLANKDE